MKIVYIKHIAFGPDRPFALIAGPCVLEEEDLVMREAESMKELTESLNIPWIFKASFDKANRSSISSFRGPGLEEGLNLLNKVKTTFDVPVITDIHTPDQAKPAADVVDALQIPAFLCRQTDLLVAAAKTGKPVNIKKGQFMAPKDMAESANKVVSSGNNQVLLTERGNSFGYNNLVVDMRGLGIMRELGYPVIFDATHSVQLPAAQGNASGGDREFIPLLSRAAAAAGVDGFFMEVHPNPVQAKCDAACQLPLADLGALLQTLKQIDAIAKGAIK